MAACETAWRSVGRPDRGQLTHACRRSRPFFRPWRLPRRWPGLWCTQAAQAIAHCLVFWPERLDQPPAEFGHFEEVSADRCGVQPRLYANHGNSTREDAVHAPPRPSWGTEAHRRRRPHRLPERRLSRQVRRDRCRPVRSCRPCARRGLRPPRRRGREHWPRHASDRRCQPFEDRRRSRGLAGLRRRRRARMPWLRRRPRLPWVHRRSAVRRMRALPSVRGPRPLIERRHLADCGAVVRVGPCACAALRCLGWRPLALGRDDSPARPLRWRRLTAHHGRLPWAACRERSRAAGAGRGRAGRRRTVCREARLVELGVAGANELPVLPQALRVEYSHPSLRQRLPDARCPHRTRARCERGADLQHGLADIQRQRHNVEDLREPRALCSARQSIVRARRG